MTKRLISELAPVEKLNWGGCYPSTNVDKPLKLSRREVSWINAFNLHIRKFVTQHPQRFESYHSNGLFETYRRRVFVFWMNTNALNYHVLDKQQREAEREYRNLVKRRRELTVAACKSGWNAKFYE